MTGLHDVVGVHVQMVGVVVLILVRYSIDVGVRAPPPFELLAPRVQQQARRAASLSASREPRACPCALERECFPSGLWDRVSPSRIGDEVIVTAIASDQREDRLSAVRTSP